MMKKLLLFFAVIGLMAGYSGKVMAQDDNAGEFIDFTLGSTQILDLNRTTPALPTLAFQTPTSAGLNFTPVEDAITFINITSVISATGYTKKIATTVTGTVPAGTILTVVATAATSDGGGTKGTIVSTPVDLSILTTQDLITGIGSCWTGDGTGRGYKLTYNWSVKPLMPSLIAVDNNDVVKVTYTISEVAPG
jgi:hypothetical protein